MALEWLASLPEGLERAAAAERPVLLDISAAPR